ncbi:MAG: hypothetical protein PHY80_01870 [Rickettsiales bacterium]|nr:hypothetical protein [Rickettsiales bacterium]
MLGVEKLVVSSRQQFFNIKRKDKGVERGFFGYLISELKTKLSEFKNKYPEFSELDGESRFDLFIIAIIQNLNKTKQEEILSSYIKFKAECGQNDSDRAKINSIKRFFRLFKPKRSAVEELAEALKNFENGLFSEENIGINNYIVYFRKIHREKQRTVDSKEIIKLKPRYLVKGDRTKFLGLSLSDNSLKSLIRNIFENHFMNGLRANRDTISELFALKFTEFLGGRIPEQSYLVKEQYSDESDKFMLASTLHENFRDFEGLLFDSNTGEQQLTGRNYNRLMPDNGCVEIDSKKVEIQKLAQNLMIFAILNDLDGVGAQGQNIGINLDGELLYFDFGHSFENSRNLGSSFIPQLGHGNVKSRNITSFFSGVSLHEQLKAYREIREKFVDNGEFDEFIQQLKADLKAINCDCPSGTPATVFHLKNPDYLSHIDVLRGKILDRIKYIDRIFGNRIAILEEENGEGKINILENLQFLIFRSHLTEHSVNGVVLKEGTSYFDIYKVEGKTNIYKISLNGHSFYGKDYQYKIDFLSLIKEFRGNTKNPFEFSEAELVEFNKFLLTKKREKLSGLNSERINAKLQVETTTEVSSVDSTEVLPIAAKYLSDRSVDAIRTILNIKQKRLQINVERINVLARSAENYARLGIQNRVILDSEYATMSETVVLSRKLRDSGNKEELKSKDIKKLRDAISFREVSKSIGATCVKTSIGFKVSIEEKEINGKKCVEIIINRDLKDDNSKYIGYKIVIANLGDYSKFNLIGNIRTYGLSKGLRKTASLARFSLCDKRDKHLKGKEYTEFLRRLNIVEEVKDMSL